MLKGCFDTTLEKYKATSAPPPAIPQQPLIQEPKEETTQKAIVLKDLIPKFNIWATAIRNIDVENTVYCLSSRNYFLYRGEKCRSHWLKEQLESYTPPVDQAAIDDAKAGMFNLLALPLYGLLFFVIPWVVLILIYWVVDADKAKE